MDLQEYREDLSLIYTLLHNTKCVKQQKLSWEKKTSFCRHCHILVRNVISRHLYCQQPPETFLLLVCNNTLTTYWCLCRLKKKKKNQPLSYFDH